MNIFCKKLRVQNQAKIFIFSAFLKKITTTKSRADFLSPDSNGQGYSCLSLLATLERKITISLQLL
jgi:hypothetical protein